MRRFHSIVPIVLLATVTACQGTTVPERREISGSWASRDFGGGTIRMTVSETAREVRGAGSWITPTEAFAFNVSGALATDEVALLLAFGERTDVSFQGFFQDDDVIVGTLTGDGFRQAPVTFDREDLVD